MKAYSKQDNSTNQSTLVNTSSRMTSYRDI